MPLVLVVDPDPDARIILEAFMQHAGYDVESAATADTGFEAIRRRGPAVIVGEHPVRSADGTSLCDTLRLDATTADIPFIALTSRATEREFQCAASSHCRVFVKPPDYAVLLQAIHEAIEGGEGRAG